MTQALPAKALKQLADATHADPFAVLGRHVDANGGVCVRALLPHAETVTIAEGNHAMRRLDGTNVFEWQGTAAEPIYFTSSRDNSAETGHLPSRNSGWIPCIRNPIAAYRTIEYPNIIISTGSV